MSYFGITAIDIHFLLDRFGRMLIALVLTFPIVAVGACGLIVLARSVLGVGAADQTHVLQGLVTGIGFIGGGAIIKANDRVHGTATAASIWATATIGAAVGYGQSEIAIVLALVTFGTLRGVGIIESRQRSG